MGKPYSMDLRERAVGAVLRGGLSRHKSAAQFGVGISTVITDWVRRFQDTAAWRPARSAGTSRRRLPASIRSFWRGASGKAGLRCAGLQCARTRRAPPQGFDYRSVWNFVHAERLSFKKKPSSPASAIDPTSRAGASSGRTGQSRIDPERLVFHRRDLDEKPTWRRSEDGRRAGGGSGGQGSLWPLENSDLPRRASPWRLHQRRHTAARWHSDQRRRLQSLCRQKVLVPTLRPGDLVIMDNLGSHKGKAVRRAIRSAGAKLFFLPKYSPDLNPIEQVFAKLKHLLRNIAAARTIENCPCCDRH